MIPSRVKVGWRVYKVVAANIEEEGVDHFGACDYKNHIMYVSDEMSYDEQVQTLLHEIMHAIFYETGHATLRDNEDAVEASANGMYSVLRANPKLLDAIRRGK